MSFFSSLLTRSALLVATSVVIAGASSVWGYTDTDLETEAAVAAAPHKATPEPASAAFEPSAIVRIDLPVAWQLTRMRMASGSPSMVTENFRETWTIEQRPIGSLFLQSPRARVEAFVAGGGSRSASLPAAWPKLLMLPEGAFARLIGLPEPESDEGDRELPGDRFVTLAFGLQGRGGSEITLRLADDQSVEVQVEVGSQALF
jgi:hypothetical protein